jgi:hypothetical protein
MIKSTAKNVDMELANNRFSIKDRSKPLVFKNDMKKKYGMINPRTAAIR